MRPLALVPLALLLCACQPAVCTRKADGARMDATQYQDASGRTTMYEGYLNGERIEVTPARADTWQCEPVKSTGTNLVSLRLQLQAALQRAETAERLYRYGVERWACHREKIRELAEQHGLLDEISHIFANGTTSAIDPPTYEQQMNILRHRAENAEKRAAQAEFQLHKLQNPGG
jgi:hypothetical protein